MNNRLEYIDIAKGIGILLVVWGHVSSHWTTDFLYTFHMPMFFIISGMLFRRNKFTNFGDFAVKRAKRLFLPYVIYSVVTWAIWACFNYVRGAEIDSYWLPLLQTVLAQGSGQFFVYNSPLWFVPCLFAIEIIYYFTSRFHDVVNLSLCFLLMGVSIIFEIEYGEEYLYLLPWNLDAALMALPMYAIGNIVVKHFSLSMINKCISQYKWISVAIVIVIAVLLYFSLSQWNSISMGHSYYGNEWIFHIRALMGTVMVLLLASVIANIKWLRHPSKALVWCGRNSLDIMCTHVPVKGIIIIVLARIILQDQDSVKSMLIPSLIAFAITMIIEILCVSLINRYIKKSSNHETVHK